ncbi:MAG: enediyne biosynthesis protein UnbU [Planctomycetes bacterium]|nr:enediyne biosynthesis protein UnbU [Planctomycetota bacterium]
MHCDKTQNPAAPNDPVAEKWYRSNRLGGLRRFAIAITLLNIFGHSWLGFEQSWLQPLVGLAAAYSMEVLMELVECVISRRRPRFLGGIVSFIDFFLPAQITGLACSMLLYSNDRLGPIAFAAAFGIASKHLLCVQIGKSVRHFYNPSNLGITVTLLLFPWVGIAPPYHFTENLLSYGDWVLPAIIICSGTFLNTRYTKRLALILAWLSGFVLQALLRHWAFGTSLGGALMPMSGVAFILYTFYMVTDPPTTPGTTRNQIFFGASVAAVYGLLMVSHIVFGLFFALTIVSTIRGAYLYAHAWADRRAIRPLPAMEKVERLITSPPQPAMEPALTATTQV